MSGALTNQTGQFGYCHMVDTAEIVDIGLSNHGVNGRYGIHGVMGHMGDMLNIINIVDLVNRNDKIFPINIFFTKAARSAGVVSMSRSLSVCAFVLSPQFGGQGDTLVGVNAPARMLPSLPNRITRFSHTAVVYVTSRHFLIIHDDQQIDLIKY